MSDIMLFAKLAQQQGFSAESASLALAAVEARLAERGTHARRFYIYRIAGGGAGVGSASDRMARPRLLLAFPSADAALGFAQRSGLPPAPRLIALSLAQLLAAMIQRPALGALLLADDRDEPMARGLPDGLRFERDALLALLARVAH